MTQFLSYTELLSLTDSQLEALKGKNISIQMQLGECKGIVSGFILDEESMTSPQIIGFIVGINTLIKFSDIKSIIIEDTATA